MKNIITILSLLIILTFSSCGVSRTLITYGDISVLGYDGKAVRQWDNCTMDTETIDGSYVTKTHAIKEGGGLLFTDDSGESHYINGGIIIVDNIRTTENGSAPSEFEYEHLKKEYNRVSKLLKTHLRGGRGPGRMETDQYDRMVAKKEYLAKRIALMESKMNEDHRSEPGPEVEYNQMHWD